MENLEYSIAAVERDTGLSKDVLRMWERRYGFPQPGRDANGERSYPADQVERLRLIKRLMEQAKGTAELKSDKGTTWTLVFPMTAQMPETKEIT